MRLSLRLAWRNLWRHRRRTLIVVLAISVTMAMMMMYDGIVGGFDDAIYGNAIRVLGGNIQVHAPGYRAKKDQTPLLPLQNDTAVVSAALAQPQVLAASRRIISSGMASNMEGAFAVSIIGIEPENEQPISLIAQHVAFGRYLSKDDQDSIFIGSGLATAMGVTVGDRITLVGRATRQQMRTRTMTIGGIYDVGMPDIEKRSVYMSLAEAQDLYILPQQSTEVVIYLKRLGDEGVVINSMQPGLPGFEFDSWENNFPELKTALETKGGVMNIFSIIILIIAGIGILNLLLMAVYERTREIGILGALGMRPRQISMLFLLEGAMMGLVGVIAGVGLGLLFNAILGQVGMDFTKYASLTDYMALLVGPIYPTLGVDKLPMRIITALVIATLAALYPAHEAAQSEPAEALHYV